MGKALEGVRILHMRHVQNSDAFERFHGFPLIATLECRRAAHLYMVCALVRT